RLVVAFLIGCEFANILVLSLAERLLRGLDVDLAGCVGDMRDLRIGWPSSVLCKCAARGKAYGGNGRDWANGHEGLRGPATFAGLYEVDICWMRLGAGGSQLFRPIQVSSHVRFGSK